MLKRPTGGNLWDIDIYPVSLAVALNRTGQPVEVWADQVVGETGIDLSMAAQLRFADGMIAHISSSFRAPEQRGARLTGSYRPSMRIKRKSRLWKLAC